MKTHNLIVNKTNLKELESFNKNFSDKVISICPLLSKFQIHIVKHYDSQYLVETKFNPNDIFAYYLKKESICASTIYAEIIVNEDLCIKLQLTKNELFAAIAHEIGHIIMFFHTEKEQFQGQAEEIYCDTYACRIGLSDSLITLLNKMIDSGLYSESIINEMHNRLFFYKSLS